MKPIGPACLLLVTFLPLPALAQRLPDRVNGGGTVAVSPSSSKRPLRHSDYDGWKSIGSPLLTRDGKWAIYVLAPQEGDSILVARRIADGVERRIPLGTGPSVTSNGKFVVCTLAVSKKEADAAKATKKSAAESPKPGLAILNLETGAVETLPRVRRFSVPEKSDLVAYVPEPALTVTTPPSPKPDTDDEDPQRRPGGRAPVLVGTPGEKPTDLVVRELATGTNVTLPTVTTFAWNKTGSKLAYVVDATEETKDGVFVRAFPSGKTETLVAGPGETKSLTFDEVGERIAFLRTAKPKPNGPPAESSLFLDGTEIAKGAASGLPKGFVVSDSGALRFSRDGKRLYFGAAPPAKSAPKNAPDPIAVDIWTSKDGILQSQQKLRAESEKRRTYLAEYAIERKQIIALGDANLPEVSPDPFATRFALGTDSRAYLAEASWDQTYSDVYTVDLDSGERQKVLTKHGASFALSPDGKFLIWWSATERAWLTRDIEGRTPPRNLTGGLKVAFDEEDWDTPGPAAPYGIAGWTAGDAEVLLLDRFDLWAISPTTGNKRKLTVGRGNRTVFRPLRLDPDQRAFDPEKPLILKSTDDDTGAEGLWTLASLTASAAEKILVRDEALGGLQKARDAETVVFTRERFDLFPDLWGAPSLGAAKEAVRLTDANPQQNEILWGRAEKITYRTGWGRELPAILIKPENFDPAKTYPMIVNFYEKSSQGLHRYGRPGPGTSINLLRYASNGYIVLQPDVEYREGYPGESAMMCVVPAVQEVLRRGYVDEKRVGVQGHSWGAYQIAYMLTRTNLFAAAEAGAAVSDMVSAYGGIRYESGVVRQFQYEKTQSRIGATPWQKPLAYIENSPIFWADKVQTPYLTIHNDADGAVPWTQGIEFFTALRRMGKESYLFNYNGEAHNLVNRENQKHWTVHMAEFFDHFLLGKPRPEWMEKGVPFLERGTRDLRSLYSAGGEK